MIRFKVIPATPAGKAAPVPKQAAKRPRAKRVAPPFEIVPSPVPPVAAQEDDDQAVLTVPQIKAARALLNWKQEDLAVASGVSLAGITNIERGTTDPRAKTLGKIQDAFERAGLEVIHKGDGKGEGLRFAKPKGERPAQVAAESVKPVEPDD